MKFLKSILALSILDLFALCAQFASAQSYENVLLLGGTNSVTQGATSNYTAQVSCRKVDYVALMVQFKMTGAGTDNIISKWSKSVDGTNFETTPTILLTNAANGTTLVCTNHIVQVSGCSAIRLTTIVNGVADQAVTNFAVRVGLYNR